MAKINISRIALHNAISKLPETTIIQTPDDYMVLSRHDCTVWVRLPTEKDKALGSHRNLWSERRSSTPSRPWHFTFRYDVSKALGSADAEE